MTGPGEQLNQQRRRLLMDRSRPGRRGVLAPALDAPEWDMPPAGLLRDDLPLPEVSQPEVVRYFTLLSQLNFSVDTNFYPLGSCTMKYNPRINEDAARVPGMAGIHPLQQPDSVQGALELMHGLQGMLAEITGMAATSLVPLAGAHGELAGVLMIRAYHQASGQGRRTKMLIPDSAHGTNPASAAMAGYDVVSIPSDDRGNMDLGTLREASDDNLAGLMITLPSTLGLFDTGILDVVSIVHEAGGLVYGDGANMNALMGRVKLGALGFDVAHLNLHKTFSTPHGGGGPGAGPICVNERLAPFLPGPLVVAEEREGGSWFTLANPEQSIGRMGGFQGNVGVLVRAYAYLRSLGAGGLRAITDNAVLNANYVMEALKPQFDLPYDRTCMHEAVFSARRQEAQGVKALDIAKRLLDYGVHAPTMYFPLIVGEALMIEPTEAETKETLDYFVEVMNNIAGEVERDPEVVKGAPRHAANTRLDEAGAARRPDLRWKAPG